ncbi:hypothetical protein PTKIN_Ptkin11bG0174300 [Pterospermum kingtungense]
MFFYHCGECRFALDMKCALLSNKVGENGFELKDDSHGHQYPFIFLKHHKDQLKNFDCSWRHQLLLDSLYFSLDCKLRLHKNCFLKLSTEIDHPCHRLHTLLLQFDASHFICKLCQKEDDGDFFYRCFACKFDIHLECTWLRPIIEDKRHHEHPFTLVCRDDSFICDACGTNGKFVSYICPTCHLLVHKNCTSLPRIIKVTRHDHAVVHKYFLKEKEVEKHVCGICFDEVKAERGSYNCLREDCNYIVHVKCATQDENLYYIIDQEDKLHETNTATGYSIMEVDGSGEAVKIKHFNHEHDLELFEEKIEGDTDRHCDGCMPSISTPFYYCSECNFFLHKTCA